MSASEPVRSGRTKARIAVCSIMLSLGCSLPPFSSWHSVPRSRSESEVGTASWYGPGFHGVRTSSGEVYNQNELTAAHQTLPLGTRVVVTNLGNGRSVEVRINDRGPFAKGRIIDLSHAAAQAIGIVDPGTSEVRVEVIEEDGGPPKFVTYAVQAGAFEDFARAVALRQDLATSYRDVYLAQLRTTDNLFYRVRLGPYDRRDDALQRARLLSRGGVPSVIVEEVKQ